MNNYLAKSNPKETIIEHTEKLIDNYNLFKKIYPNLNVDWDILYLACLYHDLGKMNRKFQEKIEGIRRHQDEIPHGILSLGFIEPKKLESKGYTKERIKLLAHAIAYHHERDFNFDSNTLKREIESMREDAINFNYERLENVDVKLLSKKYFSKNRIYEDDENDEDNQNENLFFDYVMIKGMLNRIDYAASGGIDVEKQNEFLLGDLEENLLKKFKEINPNAEWNKLQKYMIKNRDDNLIIVAQTGMGKTEAGLLWIANNKGFFTLPLKTAINAIYKRIIEKIVINDYEDKVGLLHSDIKKEYLDKKEEIDFDQYYNKTRQLSLPLTVCTIDQIFDFVYRYRGFEPKLSTLAYSKVVIDEVQMYSSELLAYLVVGLSYIDKIGGKFAILTATLPEIFVDLLEEEKIKFKRPEPFTNSRIRHSLNVIKEKLNSEFVKKLYKNNKVLVICNTVKEAQRIYQELSKDEDITSSLYLFHSRFIKKDRKIKEKEILDFGNKENEYEGIWITTQVVEASLDIDFDILVTELSDLNGLFQRLGRCYRDRDWNKEGYNCYVFNGGDYKCTGIGKVIDEDIFKLSKNALKNIDGILTEGEKIKLIDMVYTTENLKQTKYYEKLRDSIDYLKLIDAHELSKKEAMERFRRIESKTIIPRPVYEDNIKDIEEYKNILNEQYPKDISIEERKELKMKKLEARIKLDDFTVSIPSYKADKGHLTQLKITEYEILDIFDCEYNEEFGVIYKDKKQSNVEPKNPEDKIF